MADIINLWKFLADTCNKSQYFNPLFSWFVVVYTYYAVGKNAGAIWKYLFYVVTAGFIANVLALIKTYAFESNFYIQYVKYMNCVETIFFGLNEWGFVFINYKKISSCVNTLKSKFWHYLVYIFLGYVMFCRVMIAYYKVDEEYMKYTEKHMGLTHVDRTEQSTRFHAALYIPIGIIEFLFIMAVIIQYFKEKSGNIRKELSTLLHSTLFRMLIISLLYILIAIDVLFENVGVVLFFRRLLWRIKGIFGIIFLVDLLLLRIDLDNTTLLNQKEEIDNKNKEIALISSTKSKDYEAFINTSEVKTIYNQTPTTPKTPNNNNIFAYNSNNSIFQNQEYNDVASPTEYSFLRNEYSYTFVNNNSLSSIKIDIKDDIPNFKNSY